MYVKDIQQLAKSFRCDKCSMVFSSGFRLNEHSSNCTARVKETFSKWGELYRPDDNVIIQVAKLLNVYEPGMDFSYDYHAVFDYEAILHKTEENTDQRFEENEEVDYEEEDEERREKLKKAGLEYLILEDEDIPAVDAVKLENKDTI
jgi:hypothetical protein